MQVDTKTTTTTTTKPPENNVPEKKNRKMAPGGSSVPFVSAMERRMSCAWSLCPCTQGAIDD